MTIHDYEGLYRTIRDYIEDYRGLNSLLDRLIKTGDRHTHTHTHTHTDTQTHRYTHTHKHTHTHSHTHTDRHTSYHSISVFPR